VVAVVAVVVVAVVVGGAEGAGRLGVSVQVAAFSTPAGPGWRWRIVNYAGEMVEESRESFPTITAAVSHGTKRLLQMNVVDNSVARPAYRTTSHLRRR
jgi:hypothetical protein